MTRRYMMMAMMLLGMWAAVGYASDAQTSASAGRGAGRAGTAAATAHYAGDVGFARTDTRSGSINLARGVAVGVDENGISLSFSGAVANQLGLGFATNFNLAIDRDGDVSASNGVVVASGGVSRSVTAGGGVGTGASRGATSVASGNTERGGRVYAKTSAENYRASRTVEIRQPRVVGLRPVRPAAELQRVVKIVR